ncbi:MAG: ABC transporter ATP-binding protein [Microbacteriaceae bacterium]
MTPTTLIVDDLGYCYPESTRGLDSCSLRATVGTLTVIRGASGSGKSTLLACLGGILTPDRGTIALRDALGRDEEMRSSIVTQGAALFENLTAWQNVATAWGLPRQRHRSRAINALDQFAVGRIADALPREMSFGQRQRVAIAGAVAGNASVLLADEPTGSLDTTNTMRVIEALRTAAQHRIVIVVTHDDRLAREADTVIELSEGATS